MINKQEINARTEAVFNAASDRFDAPALSFWHRFGQKNIDRLSLQAGDRVLDVCCGSGASAIPAALAVGTTGQVLAIDLAESLLNFLSTHAVNSLRVDVLYATAHKHRLS